MLGVRRAGVLRVQVAYKFDFQLILLLPQHKSQRQRGECGIATCAMFAFNAFKHVGISDVRGPQEKSMWGLQMREHQLAMPLPQTSQAT